MMAFNVVVTTLAGDSIEVVLEGPCATIADLKLAIASSRWAVPPSCQMLMTADCTAPLDDSQQVMQAGANNSTPYPYPKEQLCVFAA